MIFDLQNLSFLLLLLLSQTLLHLLDLRLFNFGDLLDYEVAYLSEFTQLVNRGYLFALKPQLPAVIACLGELLPFLH